MEEDTEYKKLPIDEQCVHKLWKARVNGYEEATKLFRQIDDEKSSEWNKYLGLLKKFVIDSNALAQEKGLEATLAFVENAAVAGKTVGEVMSGIVTKCIAAPKAKTKELAVQITLMYIEIEKHEIVLEELLKGMDQKNPKIVSGCISITTLALQEFGSKVVSIKPLVKKIPIILADRDKAVRDEGKAMVIEMYRWVGAALRPQLASLQPVQVTELETEFEKVKGTSTPNRYLRSQQQKQAKIAAQAAEAADEDEEDEPDVAAEVDAYDLMDPVDILSKLPKDFYEKVEAKKWQERKEAVESLETLLKAPKLESGDYGDVVRALKKIIQKDSNVMVIALAGKCIAALASGLKKRFHMYASACVPAILEKFREKKQNVVVALREAIDAVFLSTTIEAILEDVLEALNNKNPAVKAETAAFLSRAFSRTQPVSLNKKLLKAYTSILLKTLNEPDPIVRDSSAEALGTALKLVGEKQIMPFLTEVDNLKMTKIKECSEKAVILVKVAGPKKERPNTAPAKGDAVPTVKAGSSTAKPVKRPSTATASSKKKASTAAASKTKAPPAKANKTERDMSMDEVEERVSNMLPPDCVSGLIDSNWKTRLTAVEQFIQFVPEISTAEMSTQVLVKVLNKKPGLKDTNFQVLKMRLEAIKMLAENYPFSTITADCVLADITDKLGDAKNGPVAAETLTAIAEATKLEYVANEVMSFAFNQKSPKVQQETCLWLSNAIKEFGFIVNPKSLMDNIKKAVTATNPVIRTAGITLLGTLYLYMGDSLYSYFEGEKPALRQQIDAEFEKYRDEKPPTPTRGLSKSGSRNSLVDDDDITEDGSSRSEDPVQRKDISGLITESLIDELGDKNWKVRNEALLKISAIISEAKLITPSIGDLPSALLLRLTDSNGKIAQMTLSLCETLATVMGPPCRQHVRILFPGFLQGLSDSKTWIRTASLSCINTWGDQCGYKEFFEGEMIADAFKMGSPTLRSELWTWLTEKLPIIKPKSFAKEELIICLPFLYTNLEDRNADVRKNAQDAVFGFMLHLGYECMLKHTERMKPASRTAIIASLDKARINLPVQATVKAKSTSSKETVKSIKGGKPVAAGKAVVSKPKAGATKPVIGGRKKDEDVDTSPLLAYNNLKNQRLIDEQKLRVLKWNFVTPREEFVDLLRDQMTVANVNKTLMANMFHSDFKFHLKAIESLAEDLQDNIDSLVANLDLILKWLTLRFFDTNPSVLLKGLEYLNNAFALLVDIQYSMIDIEASSFIPYLILKIGDPKDAVRNGVRALLNQIMLIYPVNRLFVYIMDGLKSKNARQRTECLDQLGALIEESGMSVCQPSAVKEIAKQISDRDNSVRNAALNCVVQAYRYEGEKIYKIIGHISDKDASLLEERIKRAGKIRPTPKQTRHTTSFAPPKRESVYVEKQVEPEVYEDEEEEEIAAPSPEQKLDIRSPAKQLEQPLIIGPFSLDMELIERIESDTVKLSAPNLKELDFNFIYDSLPSVPQNPSVMPISPPKRLDPREITASHRIQPMTGSSILGFNLAPSSSITTFSGQEHFLERTINDMASPDHKTAFVAISQMEEILRSSKANLMAVYEDQFMGAVLQQLKSLRTKNMQNPDTLKGYRACMTVLAAFYESKVVGRQISREILGGLLEQLITLLTDKQLASMPDGEAYTKVINTLCIRLIERSDHTNVTCALIKLLHDCAPNDSNASSRYVELVMKCLWKIVKMIPSWADEIDYDTVLYEIHIFFSHYPSAWWKQQQSDIPIRTIKTIVHSMAKVKGKSLLSHLTKIPNPKGSELQAYLIKILQSLKTDSPKQQIPLLKKDSTPKPVSKSMYNLLSEIFNKIGKKEETKEGLQLLYEFKEQHPESDIEPYLKRSSEGFQRYIRTGLQDIEMQRKKQEVRNQSNNPTVGAGDANTVSNTDDVCAQWLEKLSKIRKMAGLPEPTMDTSSDRNMIN